MGYFHAGYAKVLQLARGVYSSLFPYIHIYKKLPFLADFIKNLAHFIKNSILTRLVTNNRSARPNTKLFKTPVS